MYGQKNYNEILGNGTWRIAQIGCFLVSFANLLKRFGNDVGVLGLNAYFRDNNVYLPDGPNGPRQLLSWWSVGAFDNSVVVSRTGKGRPTSNNAIVKFNHIGNNGQTNLHFCLVKDASRGIVIDSWDGVERSWDYYGGPVEFAEYIDNTPNATPQPVTPLPTSSNFDGESVTVLAGWGLSNVAEAAGMDSNPSVWQSITDLNGGGSWQDFNARLAIGQRVRVKSPATAPTPTPTSNAGELEFVTVEPGWGLQRIAQFAGFGDYEATARWSEIARLNGSDNWQNFNSGLNAGDVVRVRGSATPAPATAPTPTPTPAPVEKTETVTVNKPTAVVNYKETFSPLDKQYIASKNTLVTDLDGLNKDIMLYAGQKVNAGGTFTKDGIVYVRTKRHIERGIWYGVPVSSLVDGLSKNGYVGPLKTSDDDLTDKELAELDLSLEAKELLNHLSVREKLVAIAGRIMYAFSRIGKKIKPNKKG